MYSKYHTKFDRIIYGHINSTLHSSLVHPWPLIFWGYRLESNYSIDWQALGLNLMDLVSDRELYDCSGLRNRERVLRCMTAIKARFLEMS